ncbi:PAS domain S-box protein [Nostoc sp. FACHB-888]|uniref:PAS domain S-box protein n=1 Tax=Nostoc sp. FACHB-888 TaxID=2692842 RepID=UPI001686551B|nr:PAS domain S-box protein [Nostoc sp. FACHB-888]MBD2247448.1 PAS domain S-box protein [Nostoc sp. FACHB-888]
MVEMPSHKEIEQRFGVVPNFFRLASNTPEITMNLWGFAKFAYLDSPLPSLFKERLFVYLSRFCEVRYCIARHIGFLVGLGYPAGDRHCLPQTVEQVLPLLQRSLPRGEELERAIALCAAYDSSGFECPNPDSPEESAIIACATHVFLQTSDASRALVALQPVFGTRLEILNVFLAFVRMAHHWTQLHRELRFEEDINHLLATHEVLANYLLNDPEVEDNALNQRVLLEIAELGQLKEEHKSLAVAYEVVSRENEQLPIERQQRQRVEENLRQSEARLQLALDAAQMGTFVWHIQDERAELDARMLVLFGLPTDSTLTLREALANFVHPDDGTGYAEALARAIDPTGDGALRQEIRVVHSDGAVRWLAITGQTFFETQPRRAVRMSGIAADISDRKLAQLALQRSEARLRAVTANLPNGAVFIVDRELRYQLAAGKALEQAGMTPEDLVDKTIWEALDPELATSYESYFRQALNGEPYSLEHHSHERDYASHGLPLFDAQGEVEAVLAVSYDITERKLAEVALRESEQRFRLMADAVPQIVWITDAQGRVEFFNKQWSNYTGVSYEPTTAAQVAANFVHPEDGERTMAAFNEARRTGSIFAVEHRIRSAQGAYRWFLVRAEPYRDPQTGEIVRWFGASVDIHDRKQAEQALREREQRLVIATEAAQLGIFEWRVPEDVTIWENDRLYEMFGLTPADGSVSAQEFFNSYLHPDDAQAFGAKFTQAMQTGSLRQTSYRICRRDGTIRWIEVNGQFEFAADGSLLRFVGVNADITQRKQAEATILQREAQFRQLADAMPQQVWITDTQGKTQYVNQQWTTYTGLTLEQTQDIHYATGVIHPDDFEIASQLWNTALVTGIPYQAEFRLKHSSDNIYRWFLSRAIPIRDQQGQIVQWFGTSTDIEEFRRAQTQREQLLQREQTAREAAENANRIKDEFLAVLSHELRSPLNPILGWTRLLQNGKLDAARQREALAIIERNAKLQTQLISDLLDISRIMRGKL